MVERFLSQRRPGIVREPRGGLRRQYVDPSSAYRGQMWDWDSYFTLLALRPHLETEQLARGCLENFLDHQRSDGSVPFRVAEDSRPDPEGVRDTDSPLNSAKPVLAQLALAGAGGDRSWLGGAWPRLVAHVRHWEETQRHPSGLFTWRSHRGSGADNHPGVYGRPQNATAGVDLNCLFVREYRALAALAGMIGDAAGSEWFAQQEAELGAAVRRHLWDPVAEDFCHADVLSRTPEGTNQDVDWVVPLRYRSWVGFYGLWSGVASDAQAEALVQRTFASDDLICDFGIRTMSSREPTFNLSGSSNPSNWQGPVWVMSNYIAFSGLLAYDKVPEAGHILEGTLRMLAQDIERTGTMHEFYDPETGEGLMNPGFLGWNLLATTMHEMFQAYVGS